MKRTAANLLLLLLAVAAATTARGEVQMLTATLISERPHDTGAFTQGLEFKDGDLYESTGLYGQSTLRQVDPSTGDVIRSIDLLNSEFGEGITHVGNNIIMLTWQENKAYVFDRDSFVEQDTFSYAGQGWGLCYNGTNLIMSNGSSQLTFRDPNTFDIVSSVTVTLEGNPLSMINELEYVDGFVWANIFQTKNIVKIDPSTGEVIAIVEVDGFLTPQEEQDADVLNGIAYNPATETFLITGKLWPNMFEVIFVSNQASIGNTWSSIGKTP